MTLKKTHSCNCSDALFVVHCKAYFHLSPPIAQSKDHSPLPLLALIGRNDHCSQHYSFFSDSLANYRGQSVSRTRTHENRSWIDLTTQIRFLCRRLWWWWSIVMQKTMIALISLPAGSSLSQSSNCSNGQIDHTLSRTKWLANGLHLPVNADLLQRQSTHCAHYNLFTALTKMHFFLSLPVHLVPSQSLVWSTSFKDEEDGHHILVLRSIVAEKSPIRNVFRCWRHQLPV